MALRGALTHRKTRRLARLLDMQIPCALGVMEALWHVAAAHAPDGAIGEMSNQDIADEMFWTGDADALVETLVEAEIIDRDDDHRLIVHGWAERADDAIHMSLARRGLLFANGSRPKMNRLSGEEKRKAELALATKQRTGNAQPRTDKPVVRIPCAPPCPASSPPEPCHAMPEPCTSAAIAAPDTQIAAPRVKAADWEAFLALYPARNGDRGTAKGREKFAALVKSGVPPGDLLDGVRRYRAWADAEGKTGSEYVKQIPSWLNGKCWTEGWVTGGNRNGQQRQQHGPNVAAANTVAATTERVLREIAERRGYG